jgi:preprotein translocase subunit SecG
MELTSPFTVFFLGNSLLLIPLILNQNESVKDASRLNSEGSSNPFESFTWIAFLLQLLFLLLKTKLTDF